MVRFSQNFKSCLKEANLFLEDRELDELKLNLEKNLSKSFSSSPESKKIPPLLKSKISSLVSSPEENEQRIVIDAGGTNFRIMIAQYQKGQLTIKRFKNYPMPGSLSPIDKEEFFLTLAKYIFPYLKDFPKVRRIGFCFSYPINISKNKDGYVTNLSKDIRINGLKKTLLIKNIKQKLKDLSSAKSFTDSLKSIEFILVNDTTATLLAGKYFQGEQFNYLGLVIGTGFNLAIEVAQEIINTEIGDYSDMEMNRVDTLVNEASLNPTNCLSEKRISGRYFGSNFLYYLKSLAEQGYFSPETNSYIKKIKKINDRQIYSQISAKSVSATAKPAGQLTGPQDTKKASFSLNKKDIDNMEDIKKIKELFKYIVYRSSRYAAFFTATFMEWSKKLNHSSEFSQKEFFISANGSMIEKLPYYLKYFKANLDEFTQEKSSYQIKIISNAPTIGSFYSKYSAS